MKIAKKLLFLVLPILLCMVILSACGDNNGNMGKPVKFGINLLANCSVDISGTDSSLAVAIKTTETVAKNNKNYLVVFDDDNHIRQVKFIYEHNGEEEITQEEIEASVTNLYVTSIFTYITFTRNGQTNSAENKFTAETSFICDTNNQSFVIDNSTYKLYPTNDVGTFSKIRENLVMVNNKYYELKIDINGNLALRKIVPNDNITESNVIVDKFGNVFVLNSLANEKIGNYIYYTSATDPIYLGDDGLAYRVEGSSRSGSSRVGTIRYYDENMQLNLLPANKNVRFGRYLVKNNWIYFLFSDYKDFDDWINHRYIINGSTNEHRDDNYTYISENNYCIVGYEIFEYHNVDGIKTLFYFDTTTKKSVQEIATFTNIEIAGNSLILTRETILGSQKYEVRVNNGTPSLALLVDIAYQNEIITIQPLN